MASSTTMMSAIDAIGKYEITEMFTELSVVCQTKSEIDEIDISSLSNSIRNITIALKDASNRERITEKECRVLVQCLQLYFQFKNKDKIMSTLIELFRCLRNVCASNRNNQDLIARCSDLLENIFLSIFDVINCCKEQNSHLQEDNTCFQILRCGMQFLGNFVSGNNTNKIYVWKKLNAKFGFLLSQQDAVLAQYSCMLLYNCLYALPKHQEQLVLSEDCNDITNALMKLTMVQESEWGLYVLELLLGVESFLLTAYDKISEEARLFLLDLLQDGISKSDTLSPVKTFGFKIATSNLNFLSENFKCKAERILQYASEDQENTLQPVEIMRLLAVLCCSSACESYRYLLQKDSGLLETTLVLLNSVHKLGKMGNANFAPIEKLAAVINPDGDDLTSHPAYGIKRNLIRLVGNLCWENVENQNKVRIMDGIPLLLDCCKIDARNPYIIQWVVFAIHNLCDNNLENQSVIASMQYEGVVESKTMEDLGICISEIEDKIKAASINSQNQSDNDTKTDTVHKESFNDPSVNANNKQSNFKVDNCTTADRAVNDILDLFS